MGHPVGPAPGGEAYDRTGLGGAPPIGEPMELSNSPEGRRIEQKLRAEALARRAAEEDEAVIDPTGHA